MNDSNADQAQERRVSTIADAFASAHKYLRQQSGDPFATVESINSAVKVLREIGIEAVQSLTDVLAELESQCIRLEAEFWGALVEACQSHGWEVWGTTNRRLINRGVFVALEGRTVRVEGLPRPLTPFLPALLAALAPSVQETKTSEAELKAFLSVLAKAYNVLVKPGAECSLEVLYRQCVLEFQKPTFWRSPSAQSFTGLSRPQFRYRLSEILRLRLLTSDGRAVALGTTTMSRDSWEIYSPGEQRVVIAGRLSLAHEVSSES